MSRALIILDSPASRQRAASWVMRAPAGTRCEFKVTKRTTDQNAKMWACLSDLAAQLVWHGQKLTPDDWKLVMLDGLKRELRIVPNMHGNGFVNLGRSSSDLSKGEMADLIELIAAFGAQHGVKFRDTEERGAA